MKTIVLQIGNTDNKLTQGEWSSFVGEIDYTLEGFANLHFRGFSNSDSQYQNACWVCEDLGNIEMLKNELTRARQKWGQDSLAFTVGETEFI